MELSKSKYGIPSAGKGCPPTPLFFSESDLQWMPNCNAYRVNADWALPDLDAEMDWVSRLGKGVATVAHRRWKGNSVARFSLALHDKAHLMRLLTCPLALSGMGAKPVPSV